MLDVHIHAGPQKAMLLKCLCLVTESRLLIKALALKASITWVLTVRIATLSFERLLYCLAISSVSWFRGSKRNDSSVTWRRTDLEDFRKAR